MTDKHVLQIFTYMNNCYLRDYEQNVAIFLYYNFIVDIFQMSEFLGYFKRILKH